MNIKTKRQIIYKYGLLIKEYFGILEKSEMNHPLFCVFIGITSIHRVFEHILLKTQSIDNAYYYSQKSYFYYLEYMEHVYRSNITANLNHIDAVMFIYKKTIFSEVEGDGDESHYISNMMTLQNNTVCLNESEIKSFFSDLLKTTNTLFNWTNTQFTVQDRKDICDTFLEKYIEHNLVKHVKNKCGVDLLLSYLDMIQQKVKMTYPKYRILLQEFLNDKLKKTKTVAISESEKNELFLVKFYIEESVFLDKFNSEHLDDLIRWLY